MSLSRKSKHELLNPQSLLSTRWLDQLEDLKKTAPEMLEFLLRLVTSSGTNCIAQLSLSITPARMAREVLGDQMLLKAPLILCSKCAAMRKPIPSPSSSATNAVRKSGRNRTLSKGSK